MIASLLIANRGEIACRIIRTARAMGIHTIAVYSEPDARTPHIAMADEAVPLTGATAADTYLNVGALLAAAEAAGADAVHPGYGFLAESATFARACVAAGLTWVGPGADVIAAMGDKIAAKATMRGIGVPTLPDAEVTPDTDPRAAAEALGFPLLVKAAAGGGGKGMRLVTAPVDLEEAVGAARRESAAAFGDDRVFLERFANNPRHVEVQILGDVHGTLVHLGERECSVQRRHQKVIEESPSPVVDGALRGRMTAAALAAGRGLGYTNAGTVEFIVEPDGNFAFLEVNTRLQVEHPVTELAWRLRDGTPLDLVRLQLLVAAGASLPFSQDDVVCVGHAVEARVYAEDAAAGFLPSTGTLRTWSVPRRPGIRVDAGVTSGTDVTVHYDPMLAKVIAAGPTRAEAVALLAATLHESRVHGVATNRDLLVAALLHPRFRDGDYDTSFIADELEGGAARVSHAGMHGIHATAAALCQARRHHLSSPLPTLPPGWRNNRANPHTVLYRHGAGQIAVAYRAGHDGSWAVTVDEDVDVRVIAWPDERDDGTLDADIGGRRLTFSVSVVGDHVDVDSSLGHSALLRLPRFPDVAGEDVAGGLLAPMPGSVVAVHASVGQAVRRGDVLVVLEAMKMEHRITAPHAGVVAEILVEPGALVATDDVLVVVDPE